jgi:hypothetical protein
MCSPDNGCYLAGGEIVDGSVQVAALCCCCGHFILSSLSAFVHSDIQARWPLS